MSYPTSIDSIPEPTATSATNNPSASGVSVAQTTAIVALETKLGTGASTPTSGTVLTGNGTGTSTWGATTGSGHVVLSTSPAITTPTGIVANDVGLGNVNNTSDATKLAATLLAIYPVGALYFSASVSTSPATVLGFGTWTAIGGYTLVGYKSGDTNFGALGAVAAGEAAHTLVSNEMPSHTHTASVTDPGHNHTDAGHTHGEQVASTGGGGTGITGTASLSGNSPVAQSTQSGHASINSNTTGISVTNANTGGGAGHNNIQPSFVVYMWYRSA